MADSTAPEKRFWDWFIAHSEQIATIAGNGEPIEQELFDQLRAVNSGLYYEIGVFDPTHRVFIVSANGNKQHFPAVRKLVAAAPCIPAWEIVAFKPARPLTADLRLGYEDQVLDVGDIWFAHRADGDKVNIVLYIRGLSKSNQQMLAGMAVMFLDFAIGEYAVETRVGVIDFRPLPNNPKAQRLLPLTEIANLPEFKNLDARLN